MEFEKEIFARNKVDFDKLTAYGFKKENEVYTYTTPFFDNQFQAVITIDKDGNVEGIVYDIETNEVYSLLRNEKVQGEFVGRVREAYRLLLEDICVSCFEKRLFLFDQTNRITQFVLEKYQDEPEFLWEDTPGCGIFRNKKTQKWYGAILNVDYSKLDESKSGIVEVINVKVSSERVLVLTNEKGIFKAYHMNKKYWVTVILDETVKDEVIHQLIEESYHLVDKR